MRAPAWRKVLVAPLAIGFGACAERALELPTTNAFVDASEPILDGSVCVPAPTRTRTAVPIASIEAVYDQSYAISSYASARFRINYPVRDTCDVAADVIVKTRTNDADALVLNITAFVWQGAEQDCGATRYEARIIVSDASAIGVPAVIARDAAPGGTVSVELDRPSDTGACTPVVAGANCVRDCDCTMADPAAICLSLFDRASVCGRSCTEDSDCPNEAPHCDTEDPDYRCVAMSSCRTDADCPFGQHAVDCACTPFPPASGHCDCGQPCPSGTICGGHDCFQPCVTADDCYPVCTGDSSETCGLCAAGSCGNETI